MSFDPHDIRPLFPALNQVVEGQVPIFLDGPGGTQVPQNVLEAMVSYLGFSNSNLLDSPFFAVQRTHEIVDEARDKAALFVNGDPENIIFGSSMTSLTAHLSRSIALDWQEGDEIIVSGLDHYSNVSFWQMIAQDRGVKCHVVKVNTEVCSFDYEHYESLLSEKTKLVAFTLASNLCGTRTDAKRIIKAAQGVGALTYADSVHAAVHFLPDVEDLDCDFLACSGYKFYAPHMAFVHGKETHLERMKAYKVEPALNEAPDKWETGTKSFEALAGFSAAIDYLSSHCDYSEIRAQLQAQYQSVFDYEQGWSKAFLERANTIKGMKVYGITDPDQVQRRSPTFAFIIDGHHPQEIAEHLAVNHIATGAGNFYAKGIIDALGLSQSGGVVRAGCVHYNTMEELDQFFEVLDQLKL